MLGKARGERPFRFGTLLSCCLAAYRLAVALNSQSRRRGHARSGASCATSATTTLLTVTALVLILACTACHITRISKVLRCCIICSELSLAQIVPPAVRLSVNRPISKSDFEQIRLISLSNCGEAKSRAFDLAFLLSRLGLLRYCKRLLDKTANCFRTGQLSILAPHPSIQSGKLGRL
jgi:hypothetical protein